MNPRIEGGGIKGDTVRRSCRVSKRILNGNKVWKNWLVPLK